MSADSKPSPPMHESQVAGLARLHQGKVRDIYAVDDGHMLIVTTDRLSAFDVVLPDPIPGKGRVLTQISNYWFALTRHIVPNHLSNYPLSRAVPGCNTPDENALARRARALLALYGDMADMVRLGAYRAGSDPAVDEAVGLAPRIEAMLNQARDERTGIDDCFGLLRAALEPP